MGKDKWIQSIKFGWLPYGVWKDVFGAEIQLSTNQSEDYAEEAIQAQSRILSEKLPAPKIVKISGFAPDCIQVKILAEGFMAHGHLVELIVPIEKGVQVPTWLPKDDRCWVVAVVKGQPHIPIAAKEVWYYPEAEAEEIPKITHIPLNPQPILYVAKAGPVARMKRFLDEEGPRVWRGL